MCDYYSIYKVETIGDAYMAVAGLTEEPHKHRDARNCVAFARDAIDAVEDMVWENTSTPVQIRVGVHSGPVMSGIVGRRMPRYAFYGDTVNTASRMESTGVPMQVQISEATYKLCRSLSGKADRLAPWANIGGDWVEQDKSVKGKGENVKTFLSQRQVIQSVKHQLTKRKSSVWHTLESFRKDIP